MKRNKLFEECLANVDPEVREYVRTQMDYQLMGLPTDEEIYDQFGDGVEYPNDVVCAAKWMRDIAAQKIKEQKQIDDEYWTDRLFEYTEDARERQSALIEKSKVFIKDLLISIIGCEPKEGWIEDIQNNYVKTMEE